MLLVVDLRRQLIKRPVHLLGLASYFNSSMTNCLSNCITVSWDCGRWVGSPSLPVSARTVPRFGGCGGDLPRPSVDADAAESSPYVVGSQKQPNWPRRRSSTVRIKKNIPARVEPGVISQRCGRGGRCAQRQRGKQEQRRRPDR